MSRTHARVSRALIGVLIVVVVLGVFAYFHKASSSKADPAADNTFPAATETPRTPVPATVTPTATASDPARTSTPTTPVANNTPAPATRPVQHANAAQPPTAGSSSNRPSNNTTNANQSDVPPAQAIAEARTRMANGQLLSARKILNAALQSKSLSPADTKIAKQLISEANQSIVFSPTRYADDPYGGTYTVQKGDTFARIAARNDVTADFLMNINGITDARKLRVGATLKIVHGPFHAIVDKSDFTMDIYLGYPGEPSSLYVTTYRVGLGSDDSTPTGTWLVEPQKKLKNPTYYSPRGEGIIEADDPKNPLGEYWLGLVGMEGHAVGKESYGIHGTIEPDSIGKQASMGCIRMLNEDVKQVYELLVEGKSTVIVQE